MVCELSRQPQQSPEQRRAQVVAALRALEAQLQAGQVKVAIDRQSGSVAFAGWLQDRAGLTDACTFRMLTAQGSSALRMALQKAEALAGRKANVQSIAAGVHSHDGGATWHPGH